MTFLLTFVKDGHASIVDTRDSAQAIQRLKSKVKNDPRFHGGKLEIRTPKGWEVKKILK